MCQLFVVMTVVLQYEFECDNFPVCVLDVVCIHDLSACASLLAGNTAISESVVVCAGIRMMAACLCDQEA